MKNGRLHAQCVEETRRLSNHGVAGARRWRGATAAAVVAAAAIMQCGSMAVRATTQNSTWVGGTSTNWNDATNWSPNNTFPNNGNAFTSDFNVAINAVTAGDLAPVLSGNVTIDNLTLTANATLTLAPAAVLNLNGPTLSNDGTIEVDTQGSNADLNFLGNTTITGSGTIFLNDENPNARLTTGVGATVTSGANQTINGVGEIDASFVNGGTVNANLSGRIITLQTNNMTNNALFEASNGGTLNISGITVTQGAGGQILNAGGAVNLGSVNLIGGTINGGIVTISATSNFSNVNIASGTTVVLAAGQTLNYTGATLNNNGTIQIDTFGSNADLNFLSNTTITGSGSIYLNDENPFARLTTAAGVTVTNNQTIHGIGEIDAALINNGTINADSFGHPGNPLVLQTGNVTNNNLIEATTGGILIITGDTLTQGAAGTISNVGGTLGISNATISGGTISGNISVSTSNFTNVAVAAGSVVTLTAGTTVNYTGATLTNNGIIQIDTFGSNADLNFLSNTTITGSGSIYLNDENPFARLTTAAGATVTNNQTIHGIGEIDAALINNGIINADSFGHPGNPLVLQTSNMTNNNLIEATTGGILNIGAITITQGAAGVISNANGTVTITGTTISGGAITGGLVNVSNATFSNITIASEATVFVVGGASLNYSSATLTNNGLIQASNSGAPSILNFTVNSTLTGGGAVFLATWSPNAQLTTSPGATLTNNQTIYGLGEIDASLINNGTINANATFGSHQLALQTNNMTNNNLIEATANGTLLISGITLTQGANGVITNGSADATVNISGTTLVGGSITGGLFNVANSTFSGTKVAAGASVFVPGGDTLNYTGALFTNNGTIQLSNLGGPAFLNFTGNTTLSGTGNVFLDTWSPNAAITSTANATVTNNETIHGMGEIDAPVVNNASIVADSAAGNHTLNLNNMVTNNGLIQATNTGILHFGPGTLPAGVLTGGTYQVDPGSTMSFADTLTTNRASILLTGANASFPSLATLTSNIQNLTLQNGATGSITGPVSNSGTVTLSGGPTTILTVIGTYSQTSAGALSGNGTLVVGSLGGSLATVSGLVKITSNGTNAATSTLTALTIAGGTNAWTGDLDITNNKVIIEDTATHAATLATLQNEVLYGRTHAAGITSSALSATNAMVAVIENAALTTPFTTFGGQPVDAGSILVAPELLGDADFSGKVDLTDLNIVLNNLGTTTNAWSSGNFDGAAKIDLTDLNDVLNNLGLSLINANNAGAPAVAAPEPASLMLMAAAMPLLLRKRRR